MIGEDGRMNLKLLGSSMHRILFFGSLLLALLTSCGSETVDPSDVNLGKEYIPLAIGDSSVYTVSRTEWTNFGENSTSYWLAEVVKDTLRQQDELAYVLYRYKSVDQGQEWGLDSVWTAVLTDYSYERTENNRRYVRLSFPLEKGKSWDGNAKNVSAAQNYTIESLGTSYELGDSLVYPSVCEVVQSDISNQIDIQLSTEVYAENVGLVYKYRKFTNRQDFSSPPIGYEEIQTLISQP